MYICPVCGYNKLNYPYTEDGTICPSCGTEFGYDDFLNSHAELRQQWIQQGAQWWSPNRPRPSYWSPLEQLRNIDYAVTDSDRAAIARYSDMNFSTLGERTNNSLMWKPTSSSSDNLIMIGTDISRRDANIFIRNDTPQLQLVGT
jgi:hypothetical protein